MDFSKYLGEVGLTELWNLMTAYVDGKLFIGTREEYEANVSKIQVGAVVIITDESDVERPPVEENASTAILGAALLGSLILGQS